MVGGHALHVGLYDGFGALQRGVEKGFVGGRDVVYPVVVKQGVGGYVVPACGLFAVEEEQAVPLHVLVDAVVVSAPSVCTPVLLTGTVEIALM